MKKIAFTLALVMGISTNVFAQQVGGYTGPSAVSTMTVAEVLKLGDDKPVILVGKIEKSLGNEKYTFTDNTGSVTVEIDDEEWRGLTLNENDIVEIKGEIDKDFTSFEVDVDSITKK